MVKVLWHEVLKKSYRSQLHCSVLKFYHRRICQSQIRTAQSFNLKNKLFTKESVKSIGGRKTHEGLYAHAVDVQNLQLLRRYKLVNLDEASRTLDCTHVKGSVYIYIGRRDRCSEERRIWEIYWKERVSWKKLRIVMKR